MRRIVVAAALLFATAAVASLRADEPPKPEAAKTTSATYMISGLHCSMCSGTVERSLSKVPGVRAIKVDFNTKMAKIDFDEAKVPAERVSQLIAATPHMMTGMNLHYDGWLTLKAPDLKDDASAKVAKDALGKVAGVKSVATFPDKHIVEIQFGTDGKATSAELIDALGQAGIKAENF